MASDEPGEGEYGWIWCCPGGLAEEFGPYAMESGESLKDLSKAMT